MTIHPVHFMAVAALLLPTLSLGASRAMALLFIVTVLGVIGLYWRRYGTLPRVAEGVAPVFFIFLAYAAITILWSIDPVVSLRRLGAIAGFILGGMFLVSVARDMTMEHRRLLGRAVTFSLLAGLLFLAFETMTDAAGLRWIKNIEPDSRFAGGYAINVLTLTNNGAALQSLILPVIAVWLWARGRKTLALGLGLFGFAVLVQGAAGSAKVGLILATAVSCGIWLFGLRRAVVAFGAAWIVFALSMPLIAGQQDWRDFDRFEREGLLAYTPTSGIHRLLIYSFVAEKITEKPLLGWGLNTSRVVPGGTDTIMLREKATPNTPEKLYGYVNLLPLHPHNIALQWWLELGLVGVALGVAVVVTLVRCIATVLPRRLAGGTVLAQLTIWTTVSFLSYGAWQDWWLGAVALIAALSAALLRDVEAVP